jgi:PAS domain S-box-containing protein
LSVEDLIPEHLKAQLRARMVRFHETGRGTHTNSHQLQDLPAVHKEVREIRIEMSPIGSVHDSNDERFVLAIVRDITERERTHGRLIESERRFVNVLSNARAYVYRCLNQPGWPNEFASDYALELTGYSPEDLRVGGTVSFGDLIVEEDRQRVWEEVQLALRRRERFNVRYAIRHRNGEIRHVEDQGQGIYDEEGNVEVLEGIVYDATENEIFFTTSIGISLSTSEKVRAEEVLRDADLAMYQAKEKGKGGYQVFDSAMYDRVLKRLSLESDLRRAISQDEFVVHYQPKVLLETGRIVGVEALIRWESPERGLTLPAEFVPMAEELRLIVPVGREVLKEACQQASEWRERYPENLLQMVSVNLSASQLQHPDLLREVSETLQRTELDPRNLTLEITESVVMSDAPSNIATLVKLRHLGLEMAIDDFGTGYSSLSYLKRFPVSYLKIDRSFVEGLREGSDDKVVVSGIIALAHTLGMRTIAEGVETAEQLRILRQIGCDMAQGHYFSPPLAPDAASELLAADPRW